MSPMLRATLRMTTPPLMFAAVLAAVAAAGCDGRELNPTGQGGAAGAANTGAAGTSGAAGTGGSPQNVAACGPSLLMLGGTGRIAFDSDREDFNRDIYTIRVD